MYNDGRIKMFVKKIHNFLEYRKILDFFYRLDIIRNIKSNGEKKDFKFAYDEKLRVNYYLNKLMPTAYKDNEINYRQTYQNYKLEKPNNPIEKTPPMNISNTITSINLPSSTRKKRRASVFNTQGNIVSHQKLGTINSKFNNYGQGENSELNINFNAENNINNTFQVGKSTILSREFLNKKEMFNPKHAEENIRQQKKKKTIINQNNHNSNISNNHKKISNIYRNRTLFQNQLNNFLNPNNKRKSLIYSGVNSKINTSNLNDNFQRNYFNHFSHFSYNYHNLLNHNSKFQNNNYLRIGDLVLIRYEYKIKSHSKNKLSNEEGILCPEKIISKQLFCIPMTIIENLRGGKSIFKRSLFRIENPQNSSFQKQYFALKKNLKNIENNRKLTKEEEKNLKELSNLSREEKKGNQSEFSLNYNNIVAYGEAIQLRNVFTNELLIIDHNKISNEIGCIDVVLNPLGGQNAWFKLIPSSKIRHLGESVFYSDNFFIMSCVTETESFIHVNINSKDKSNLEVNLSNVNCALKFSLFDSAEDIKNASEKNYIKSTSTVKLFSQDYNGYLCAKLKNMNELLPKLKTDKRNQNDDEKNEEEESFNNDYNNNNYNNFNNQDEEINTDNINLNNNELTSDFSQIQQKKNSPRMVNKNSIINDSKYNNDTSTLKMNEKSNFTSESNINNNLISKKNNLIDDYNTNKSNIINSSLSESDSNISLSLKISNYFVSLNTDLSEIDNSNYFWEIQYEKPYEGKIIYYGCPVRFRHIPSGLYLSFNSESNEIALSNNLNDESVFYIYADNQDYNINNEIVTDKSQVYFYAKGTDSYLKIDINRFRDGKYNMILGKEDKMDYEKMVFKIELQNNSLVKINYNAALIVYHLLNLFENINSWGIRVIEGDEIKRVYVYDYFIASEDEERFKNMIKTYKIILNYIKDECLENKIGSIHFRKFQNIHTQQRLIYILLNYILLFDGKSIEQKEQDKGFINEGKEKLSPEKIALKYTVSAVDLTFEILELLIQDNKSSSSELYECINIVNDLYKTHTLAIIRLMILCLKTSNKIDKRGSFNIENFEKKQNYKRNSVQSQDIYGFGNKYSQISFWKNKLSEIDETLGNIEEQTLYFQILQMLCLNSNGTGIYINQIEIKIKLFENDLIPLKFGNDYNNRPYIIFNTKLTYDEFFSKNSSLNIIKTAKNNFKDVPIFYYDDFTSEKFPKYINYINAILDLYYATCVSRNQLNIHIISNTKHVGLSISHIWQVIMDSNIEMSIRMRYIKLFRVLFIDSEPNLRITDFRMKVFYWNNNPKEDDDILEFIYRWFNVSQNQHNENDFRNMNEINKDKFDFLKTYIKNFFRKDNNFETFANIESMRSLKKDKTKFIQTLDFIQEIFILTKEIIDFGFLTYKEINEICLRLSYFFSVFDKYKPPKEKDIQEEDNDKSDNDNDNDSNNNFIKESYKYKKNKKLRESHWLANLACDCIEGNYSEIKLSLLKLYEYGIEIISTICVIKEDVNIYKCMNIYRNFYYDGYPLTNTRYLVKIYNLISKNLNILNFEFENEEHNNNDKNSNLNKEKISIDIDLLGIIFNDFDNEFSGNKLDEKALELLVNYFDEFDNLKKNLATMEILVNSSDITLFENLVTVNQRILEMKDLIIRDYVSYKINQNTEKQGNLNRLLDLKRNIDVELIARLDLNSPQKLCKIQNFCNHLKIHETLIDLLSFLLEYDKNLTIYNSIFKFLYYFCFRNYSNQMSLKKYFDPFLVMISTYSYVCEVLTEILNIYKETGKNEKYIKKIFSRITDEKVISSETIDLLRSLNINYRDQNIYVNQIIIIQNIFVNSNAIKITIFDIEKKEFEAMLNNIKTKQSGYQKLYMNLIRQIKFVELLSSCAINNIFSVMNCRKLITIENLVKNLTSNEIPYPVKLAFLSFFKNIFYPIYTNEKYNEKEFSINYAFEVFQNLIVPEINLFYFYANYFLDRYTSTNNKISESIPENKKNIVYEIRELILKTIKDDPETKELLTIDIIDLRLLETTTSFNVNKYITEFKKKEYMNFFLNENINYNLKQEGVLIFIFDIFKYIEINKIKLTKDHRTIILKLKKKLSRLMDFLTILEEKIGEDSKITELEYQIQKCLIAAPKSNYEEIVNKLAKNKQKRENNKNQVFEFPLLTLKENNKNNNKLKIKEKEKEKEIINEKEQQNASKVLKLIQEYLIVNDQNVTGIFHLLDTDNDKQIDKFEFKRNLKLLLNNKVTNEEIEDTMNFIDTDQNNKISLKELTNYLQKFHKAPIKGKKQSISKQQDISEFLDLESKIDDKSLKIESIFRSFILSFHELQEKIGNDSVIGETAEKINSLEVLKKGDFITKFIKGAKDLSDKKFKLYLLKFIQEIIYSNIQKLQIKFNKEKLSSREKLMKLNEIRSQINYSSLIDYAIVLIDKNSDLSTIEESINLLILLLSHENLSAQIAFYQYFSDHPKQSFKFLSFIRWLLNITLKKIEKEMEPNDGKKNDYYKNKKKSFYSEIERHNNHSINLERVDNFRNFSSFRIFEKMFLFDEDKYFQLPKKIFLLIQLLCNNCFEPFQHFFRNQEYSLNMSENISSINLVYDNATFLISLLSYENSIFYSLKTLDLINQCFLTLSDYCFGPCKENQILLGSRRNLYKMINNLLKNDYNFIIKEEINQKKNLFFCHLIHFLKSLTTRETLKEVGEILIDEIEANFLIEKLIDIYVMKIKPNKERLFSGEICKQAHFLQNNLTLPRLNNINIYSYEYDNKCTSQNCINGKISGNDLKIINTGFDIFIILMYLKDIFPTNLNLSWFKFKFDFTQNLQLQSLNAENEIKKNHRKKNNFINKNIIKRKKKYINHN